MTIGRHNQQVGLTFIAGVYVRVLLCRFSAIMKRFYILFMGILCWACAADSSQIGLDFFKEGSLDVSYIDSTSVKLSTVKFDSLGTGGATLGTKRVLIGSAQDEKLGRISSVGFMQFQPSIVVDLPDAQISFDRLSLYLRYDKYSYYDTTTTLTLNVYRLTELLKPGADNNFYNTRDFSFAPQPIGTVSFRPRPHTKDSVEIVLDPTLGQDFFERAQKGDLNFASAGNFAKYFQGLVIVPDTTTSTSLVGFSSALTQLRLYYTDRTVVPTTRRYVSFPITSGYSFSKVITNRGTSKLRTLKSIKDKLSATETDGIAFMQAGAGLALRLDMPYLRDFKQLTNFYMTQAVLEIYPVRRSYTSVTDIPSELLVYRIDNRNATYSNVTMKASLVRDQDLGRDTRYRLDVTTFVKEQMELQTTNQNALLFLTESEGYRTGVNRIYFATPSYEYNTRLRIYYATINE